MNERIENLAGQCWSHYIDGVLIDGHLHFDYKKFAELIVGECIDIADDYDGVGSTIVSRIKEHFGVEE